MICVSKESHNKLPGLKWVLHFNTTTWPSLSVNVTFCQCPYNPLVLCPLTFTKFFAKFLKLWSWESFHKQISEHFLCRAVLQMNFLCSNSITWTMELNINIFRSWMVWRILCELYCTLVIFKHHRWFCLVEFFAVEQSS